VGEGYELWQTASFTFEESGTLLSGNYNLPIAAGGTVDPDWNFLGNPYPCGIDWAQVSDKTNVVGSAFYVYNGSSYVNHNGTSGTANSSVIPPMQGFFVKHKRNGNWYKQQPQSTCRQTHLQKKYESSNLQQSF
jgi:hypothetical protein